MDFQPGGRKGFLGGSLNVSKICISIKITNVQVRTCFSYPHLNNFTLHCTYITQALKYIEPVLWHICMYLKVRMSIYVQCAFSAFAMICNYMAS